MPVDDDVTLPAYSDWIENAVRTVRDDHNPSAAFRNAMDTAVRLYAEVHDSGRYLLHGDLHHDNILLDSDGGWKVIDPQGVIGPAILECGRFIQNHVIDDDGVLDREKAGATIRHVAKVLGSSARSVAIVVFILNVLSFCWGFEMNYTAEQLNRGAEQRADLLTLIPDNGGAS